MVETWGARVTFWIMAVASFLNMLVFLLIQKVNNLIIARYIKKHAHVTSWKYLHMKATPDLHHTYSKMGETRGRYEIIEF